MQNDGSLKMAHTWKYNSPSQVRSLPDDLLKEEWESVKANGKAFFQGGVPWTDELFWCFCAFGREMTIRGLPKF